MEENFNQKSHLTFKLGKETFAFNVSRVLNILEMPVVTAVPKMPEFMIGVTNLWGEVLPVIDSHIKFGMPPTIVSSNTCVLVLEIEQNGKTMKVGAMVDTVEAVIEIERDQIKDSPTIGTKYNTEFIVGMVQQEYGFIMILNVEKVFSLNDISIIKQIEEVSK